MTSFHIPRLTADRLMRLPLACANESGPLGHIGVRVTPTAVRFAATNGRILASLVVPLDSITGEPSDTNRRYICSKVSAVRPSTLTCQLPIPAI